MTINFNPNSYTTEYLRKLARHEVEPTLEILDSLDWKKVSALLPNSKDYVHLRGVQDVLQQKADKIKKPVGQFIEKHFKKTKPPEIPMQFREGNSSTSAPWDVTDF